MQIEDQSFARPVVYINTGIDLLHVRNTLLYRLRDPHCCSSLREDIEDTDLERLVIDYAVQLFNKEYRSVSTLRNWLLSTLLELSIYPKGIDSLCDILNAALLNALAEACPVHMTEVIHAQYQHTALNRRSYFRIAYNP